MPLASQLPNHFPSLLTCTHQNDMPKKAKKDPPSTPLVFSNSHLHAISNTRGLDRDPTCTLGPCFGEPRADTIEIGPLELSTDTKTPSSHSSIRYCAEQSSISTVAVQLSTLLPRRSEVIYTHWMYLQRSTRSRCLGLRSHLGRMLRFTLLV